jgi:hypothetical protein
VRQAAQAAATEGDVRDESFPGKAKQAEEEYFRRKEQELVAKLKEKSERETRRKGLAEAVGVSDDAILAALEEMGFSRDVVVVLHLFPLVAVAWADGELADGERGKIVEAARAWGIAPGTPADAKLQEWLSSQPDAQATERALRVIRDIAAFRTLDKGDDYRANILGMCEAVAGASGGFLGLGSKVSAAERAVIERIAGELVQSHTTAVRKVLGEE